jgi:hypothetical protein
MASRHRHFFSVSSTFSFALCKLQCERCPWADLVLRAYFLFSFLCLLLLQEPLRTQGA